MTLLPRTPRGIGMLSVYVPKGNTLERKPVESTGEIPEGAVWLDLVTPNQGEDKLVERAVGIAVPTREEMQEIEVTSRLYVENGARYMTATLMCQSETDAPMTTAVTFILEGIKLGRTCSPTINGETVMMELLDAVIDRAADILERISANVDQVSHDIFEPADSLRSRSYNDILRTIGRKGDLTSKVRESLVSIGRLLLYLANEADS